jgi:hypothetical protein
LNSFTDFLGLEVINPRTTHVQVAERAYSYTGRALAWTNQSVLISRITSIPSVTIRTKYISRISPVRGATACSLLVGYLKDAVKVSSKWRRRGPASPWDDLHARGF